MVVFQPCFDPDPKSAIEWSSLKIEGPFWVKHQARSFNCSPSSEFATASPVSTRKPRAVLAVLYCTPVISAGFYRQLEIELLCAGRSVVPR